MQAMHNPSVEREFSGDLPGGVANVMDLSTLILPRPWFLGKGLITLQGRLQGRKP